LRKFFISLTYDFLLIARNSQARRKSGVSAALSYKILCKSGPCSPGGGRNVVVVYDITNPNMFLCRSSKTPTSTWCRQHFLDDTSSLYKNTKIECQNGNISHIRVVLVNVFTPWKLTTCHFVSTSTSTWRRLRVVEDMSASTCQKDDTSRRH